MATVHANGLDFHVNRFRTGPDGDRPVVVCVHGLAVVDNAATSFVLGFDLAKDADVVAYDLRGHGRSEQPPTGYSLTDHVADLVALLDALDLTAPVHLVGFSYGGAIVTLAAARHPERVASLTLLDGLVPASGWEKPTLTMVEKFEAWLDNVDSQGVTTEEIHAQVVDQVIDEYGISRRRASALTRRVHRLFERTSLRDDIRAEVVLDKDDLGQIRCPVLGVYGTASEIFWIADLLPEVLDDVTIEIVEGADHLDVYWRINEIRPIVRRFIGLTSPTGPDATGR